MRSCASSQSRSRCQKSICLVIPRLAPDKCRGRGDKSRDDQYGNAAGGGECGGRRGGIRCRGNFRRSLREKCIFLQPVD